MSIGQSMQDTGMPTPPSGMGSGADSFLPFMTMMAGLGGAPKRTNPAQVVRALLYSELAEGRSDVEVAGDIEYIRVVLAEVYQRLSIQKHGCEDCCDKGSKEVDK